MEKTKLARKLMSKADIKNHVPKFSTKAWIARKEAIAKRVAKKTEVLQAIQDQNEA